MHCQNCGTPLTQGASACPHCGAPVNQQAQQGVSLSSFANQNVQQKKSPMGKIIAIVAGAIVLLIVILIVVFILGRRSAPAGEPDLAATPPAMAQSAAAQPAVPSQAAQAPAESTAPAVVEETIILLSLEDLSVRGATASGTAIFGADYDTVEVYAEVAGQEAVMRSKEPVFTMTNVVAGEAYPFDITLDDAATYDVIEGDFHASSNDIFKTGSSLPLSLYRNLGLDTEDYRFLWSGDTQFLSDLTLPITFS